MRTRYLLLSALVLAIGGSIFYAGTWFGGRQTPDRMPRTADLHVPKTIEQPPKPEPKPAPEAVKPSSTKTPSKVTVSDKEYARGKVIDPAGKPLSGAEITVGGAWPTHALTDSDGSFRVEVPQLEWKPGG